MIPIKDKYKNIYVCNSYYEFKFEKKIKKNFFFLIKKTSKYGLQSLYVYEKNNNLNFF